MSTFHDAGDRPGEPRMEAGGIRTPAHPMPLAPAYEDLPERKPRTVRHGPALGQFSLVIEVATPILGGSSLTRAIDDVDVIRPATVRGHLRFWWRALHGHKFGNANELCGAESAIWGHGGKDEGGRSAVEIHTEVQQAGDIDIHLVNTPGAYALWPARAEGKTDRKSVV